MTVAAICQMMAVMMSMKCSLSARMLSKTILNLLI